MLIQTKLGNLHTFDLKDRFVDGLPLEWYETNKRMMHKRTTGGRELVIRFLKENPEFGQDDVVFESDDCVIAVEILECEAIVLKPTSMFQMATLCYEIGNKHVPLFLQGDELAVPYEAPLFHLLSAAGYAPVIEKRKLQHGLKTTVSPHALTWSPGLFSRTTQLTTPGSDV